MTRPLYACGLILFAGLFLVSGVGHFAAAEMYLQIMPPFLPTPRLLVEISGVAEILGGLGLLIPQTRWVAAWGLFALLIAVFPANLYMAMAHLPLPGLAGEAWVQWGRLPLQIPLLWWAWQYTKR